ncbi:SET methyltransferase domain containing protein [Nitzschia inconspicua]|uniref:SET methyltransferase domain containing protein n=1 Tax=Nitzschia inconspicua TaxID=303405 RepID=A0A9K3KQG9_9STRA|nr:SET methyltransferase domain containing protein [Nitzschia inconspicua]
MLHRCNILTNLLLLLFLCHCGITRIKVALAAEEELATNSDSALPSLQVEECVVDLNGQCQNTDTSQNDKTEVLETEFASEDDDADEEDDDADEDANENDDDVWIKGRAYQIGEYLKCPWNYETDESESSLVEIHTDGTWKKFNEIYHQVVDRERSSLPPQFEGSGFQVPVEIKYMKKIGRGVFAKESIPRGQLVWKSINTAEFIRPQDYRDFLRALPQNLACDVIIWAYTRMISREQKQTFKVCVDLDEGSFVNHSRNRLRANMELGIGRLLREDEDEEITWYGCDLEFYANRDIEAGEEIRANYDEFAELHGWGKMGL